jgi:calcineurin-like phosphoesterase family protein
MSNIFFTADTHFNHANIIFFCGRPFADVEDMNEVMIENWNSRIGGKDTVYHLGDFAWGDWEPILRRLKGRKILIRGGHDKKNLRRAVHHFQYITDLMDIRIDQTPIVLCHYCLRVWNRSHYDSWHLFGHSHGRLPALGKSLDVGVDAHGFTPWSWEEIEVYMAARPHNENFLGQGT